MKCSPYGRVFLGALLVVLSVDGCCGQSGSGDCSYQYCSHTSMYACTPGGLLRLQCVVYNAANIIQVKWYHSLNGNPTELNITTGERYIVNEADAPSIPNCTGNDWRSYELQFNYTETDSGSYWCQIVIAGNIHLDLSEPWMLNTASSSPLNICGAEGANTDPKCVELPTATPTLLLPTVLPQDYSTSAVSATIKPFVSAATMISSPVETPSHSTAPPFTTPPLTTPSSTTLPAGCTVGGTSCFVYLAAGLGVLAIIVVLLVVVVIVLVCISVRRGKKKGKGKILVADSSKTVESYEKIELQQNPDVVVENSLYYTGMKRPEKGSHKKKDTSSKSYDYVDVDMAQEDMRSSQVTAIPSGIQASVDKSTEEQMHMYDVVAQPVAGSTDQQHIYSRTQHGSIKQQTGNECHQHVTDGNEYERLDGTKLGQKREMRVGVHEYDRVSPGEQQRQLGPGSRPSQEHLYHVLEESTEVGSRTTNATTTEDTYSTPNFERSSSMGQPQTGKEADDDEHNYDEPIHQNWPTTKLKDEVDNGHGDPEVLFDDPSYQAPVMSTQPHTLSHDLSYDTKVNPSSEVTPVQDQGKLVSDPAYQVSAAISPARRLTASEHSRSSQKSKTDKESDTITPHTPEDEYDQPTAITATSKGSSSAEGDQSALFDDPIYSAQI